MSSQLQQVNFYHQHIPRDANNEPQAYDQYVTDSTPKKLPSIDAATSSGYATPRTTINYTYGDSKSYELQPQQQQQESPIRRSQESASPSSSSIKLPSFNTLLQSIKSDNTQTTLSFDTPLMNSLQLENSGFRALPNSTYSSPSVNKYATSENATFTGAYNYSKLQLESPYSVKQQQQQQQLQSSPSRSSSPLHYQQPTPAAQILAPAPSIIGHKEPEQSPLQFQHEKFSSIVASQPQFTFQHPQAQAPHPMIQLQQQQQQQVPPHQQHIQQQPHRGVPQIAQVISDNEFYQRKLTDKRFICKTCSRGFNTAGNLSRHKKVHTGEKKYKCYYPGCESKFARSDSCMQHYRTHANENGYTSRRFKRLRTSGDSRSDSEEPKSDSEEPKSDSEQREEHEQEQEDSEETELATAAGQQKKVKLSALVC